MKTNGHLFENSCRAQRDLFGALGEIVTNRQAVFLQTVINNINLTKPLCALHYLARV